MPITPVEGSGLPQDYFQSASAAAPASELDKNAFLQLLVTALQYQDPSEPMSTADLMSQTTQLSTMEQLTTLTELSQESFIQQVQSSAITLVGRTVEYHDGSTMRTGVVHAVDFSTIPPLLEIDGQAVTYGSVRAVVDAAAADSTDDSTAAGSAEAGSTSVAESSANAGAEPATSAASASAVAGTPEAGTTASTSATDTDTATADA